MQGLGHVCAALMVSLVLPTTAVAAEATSVAIRAARQVQTGVVIEANSNSFRLVTLGHWPAPPATDQGQAHDYSDTLPPKALVTAATVRLGTANGFRRAAYLPQVKAAERQFALPAGLLDALIWVESRYDPLAVSKAGATGLGQLMPATAKALGVINRYDPRASIRGAARYLRQMLDRFGMVHLAIAAYNSGPGAVEANRGIPQNSETPDYVRQVISTWRKPRP